MSDSHTDNGEHATPSRLNTAGALILFAIPVFATLAYGAVETWSFAVISLATGLFVAVWCADSLFSGHLKFSANRLQLPIAGLILIGLIQLLPLRSADATSLSDGGVSSISINPYATRIAVVQLIIQLVFFAGALVFFDSARRLRRLTYFFVVFAAVMAFFGILQWLANPQGIYGWRPTPQAIPFASFVNQHHFAALMEMSVGISLGLLFGGATKKDKRLLVLISLTLMAIAIVLTGSRGGLLSLIAVFVFAAAFGFGNDSPESDRRFPRKLVIAGAGAAFAIILVGLVIFLGGDASLIRGVGVTNQADFTSGRFHFWWVAVKVFADYPFIGAGLDAFGTAFPRYDTWNGTFRVEQAHNDYLQILADAGILGFACIAAFVVLLFRQGLMLIRTETDKTRRGIAVGALAGCVGILTHSFFDFPLRTPANAFFFLILAVLATSPVRFPKRHRSHHH